VNNKLIAILVLLAPIFGPLPQAHAAADAVIYYQIQSNSFNSINSDGTSNTTISLNSSNYRSMAQDGTYVYYAVTNTGIVRYKISDGTSSTIISTTSPIEGIYVDATYIYYTVYNTGIIRRLKDGTGSPTTLVNTTSMSGFRGIHGNGSKIYFSVTNATAAIDGIYSMNYDGSSVTQVISGGANINFPYVFVTNTELYISNLSSPAIAKASISALPMSLASMTTIVSGSGGFGVQVVGNNVYYSTGSNIYRVSTSGGASTPIISASAPYGIAVVSNVIPNPTISINSGSSQLTFRSSYVLTATTGEAGRVTFFANDKKIAGCINVPTVTSGSITASCTYKPSRHGVVTIYTKFLASSGNPVTSSSKLSRAVVSRISTR
jgi:hypothetical protein